MAPRKQATPVREDSEAPVQEVDPEGEQQEAQGGLVSTKNKPIIVRIPH